MSSQGYIFLTKMEICPDAYNLHILMLCPKKILFYEIVNFKRLLIKDYENGGLTNKILRQCLTVVGSSLDLPTL